MPEDRWEVFARDNAEYHILTSDVDYSTPEKLRAFFELGRQDVDRILQDAAPYLQARRRALEIGCGVGRITIPMAEHFDVVTAIDVAPTMLRKLAENCTAMGVDNVEAFLPDETWDARSPVDLAYSRIVFQHIERWQIISEYVQRTAAVVAPGGVCHFQFDTRPRGIGYRMRMLLPDGVLPRRWRRGLRRVRRSPRQVRELCSSAGLNVVAERGAGSEHHTLILVR